MRKYLPIMFFAALFAFAGCNVEEEQETVVESARSIRFVAGEIATRTAFGAPSGLSFPTFWTENDNEVSVSLNHGDPDVSAVEVSEDGVRAVFSVPVPPAAESYNFRILSPASAVRKVSSSRGSWLITIPSAQTPLAGSADERAQIISATTGEISTLPEEFNVHFSHVTAYIKLTLSGFSPDSDETLSSVTLTSGVPFAGEWYYEPDTREISAKEASRTITATTSSASDVWFACAPVDLSGATLTIVARTGKGRYTKTLTLPEGRNLTPGKIAILSPDFSDATFESSSATSSEIVYQNISALSDLSVGDYVIFTDSATPAYAMTAGTGATTGIPGSAAGTGFNLDSDNYIRLTASSTVQAFKVNSISGSKVTFTDGGSNYLSYNKSGNSRYLAVGTGLSEETWTVGFSNGLARVYAAGSMYGRTYNYYIVCGSGTFNVTTTSSTVAIWKQLSIDTPSAFDPTTDAILGYSEFGAYLSSGNYLRTPADQISREYNSDGTVTFSIISPAEVQLLEFSGIPENAALAESFTLRVKYCSGAETVFDKEYTVWVAGDEGSVLHLTDGKGGGFIVKR